MRDPNSQINPKGTVKRNAKKYNKSPRPNSRMRNTPEMGKAFPNEICYGILGTGNIGSEIVNKLVKVRKKIYIWNRSESKSKELVRKNLQSRIKICLSPHIVMQHSHIIFNCVSDSQASYTIITRTLDTAHPNFMYGKGLVDMSGINPENSKKLCELVNKSGGKYLEARIQQGKVDGVEGGYLFLVAGNKELYNVCENCFFNMGGTPIHFKEEVGYVTKLNIVLQIIKSSCLVGLTEGCSLLERLVPKEVLKDMFQIIADTPLASDYLKSKVDMIHHNNFKRVEQSLQNLGRDIKHGLEMSNEELFITALLDQIFKYSQKLGHGDKDPSAIFLRARC